jgi:hypothetical protein
MTHEETSMLTAFMRVLSRAVVWAVQRVTRKKG